MSGFIVFFVLVVIFISVRQCKTKFVLPEKFKAYRLLSEGHIESDSYEIVKMANHWKGPAEVDGVYWLNTVFSDEKMNAILFVTNAKEYELTEELPVEKEPYHVYWKMNGAGHDFDSIRVDYSLSLYNSGVFFGEEYYVDWVNTGDKTKHQYTEVIEGDQLSLERFEELIGGAQELEIGIDSEAKETSFYLKYEDGWMVLKSKVMFDKSELSWSKIPMHTIKPYKEKQTQRFSEINDHVAWPKKKTDPAHNIYTEYFVKERKSSISLGDYNNHGRSGWSGMGYFRLEHNGESLNFKATAFNHRLDRDIVYYPTNEDQDFVIIYLLKRASDERNYPDSGIFVLRKKKKQDISAS